MWREFFISGYRVVAKVYELPSKMGILGYSRVSKLDVIDDRGKILLHYDRGMDHNHLSPDTFHTIIDHLSQLIGGMI